MKNKTFFTILAGLLLTAMCIKVTPWDKGVWGKLYYLTSSLKPGEVIEDKEAVSQALRIRDDIANNAKHYTPAAAYRHMLQIEKLYSHVTDELVKIQISNVRKYAADMRGIQPNYSSFRDELSILTSSEEYRRVSGFSPNTFHSDWKPLIQYEAVNYWPTILFAIGFWICWRLRQGTNPVWDLFSPMKLFPALAFWPVGLYFLLVKDPVRKLFLLAWACTYAPCYALTVILSLFSLGIAKAQKADSQQQDQTQSSVTTDEGRQIISQVNPAPATIQLLALDDGLHTRQVILVFTDGLFALIHQDQKNLESGAVSSFTGAGVNLHLGRHISLIGVFGPQDNLLLGKVDSAGSFVNVKIAWKGLHLNLINRLTFGFDHSKTASTDRHLQNIHGPPVCSRFMCKAITGFSVELEQKHVMETGRWTENDLGLLVNPGQIFRMPDNIWGRIVKVFNLYGYYDTYLNRWDRRLWLSYTHQFGN